jgi:FATC domain
MTIKGKLGGQINKEELPLSAEGQVDELIRMATAPDRLSAMYVGKLLSQTALMSVRLGSIHVDYKHHHGRFDKI